MFWKQTNYDRYFERYEYVSGDGIVVGVCERSPGHFNTWGQPYWRCWLSSVNHSCFFFATHNLDIQYGAGSIRNITEKKHAKKIVEIWAQEGKERWINIEELG